MTRTLCTLGGIILIFFQFLAHRPGGSLDSDRAAWSLSRGGSTGSSYAPYRCDGGPAPGDGGGGHGYVGCTMANAACTQCVVPNPNGGTMGAQFVKIIGARPLGPTGYMYDTVNTQDCGTILNGVCIVNPDPNSSGFYCTGVPGNTTCGVANGVVAQTLTQ